MLKGFSSSYWIDFFKSLIDVLLFDIYYAYNYRYFSIVFSSFFACHIFLQFFLGGMLSNWKCCLKLVTKRFLNVIGYATFWYYVRYNYRYFPIVFSSIFAYHICLQLFLGVMLSEWKCCLKLVTKRFPYVIGYATFWCYVRYNYRYFPIVLSSIFSHHTFCSFPKK